MSLRLFLGVDGGQSSTIALIGDESGSVVGHGSGGPCNHVKAEGGREKFVRAIRECLSMACAHAGLDTAAVRFASACLGFSGGPADKVAILREILAADELSVTTDYATAVEMAKGELSAMAAFMSGRVQISNIMTAMGLQGALGAVGAVIKAIDTEY